jgi:hypothetical protein
MWVDDDARGVREQLRALAAPARIGHGDWESQNISWTDGLPLGRITVAASFAQPEAAVVGLAAAVWPAAGAPGEAASAGQTEDFIVAYQRAGGCSGRNRRSRTPGPPTCGSACSTRRRTLPRAADRNSTASLPSLTSGWPGQP